MTTAIQRQSCPLLDQMNVFGLKIIVFLTCQRIEELRKKTQKTLQQHLSAVKYEDKYRITEVLCLGHN